MIDGQLRAQDRAAWRTQAFVLALTGDPAGAGRIARNVMPAGGAEAMAPFFARLAGLTPSQKAQAVHFGRFPNDGRTAAAASGPTRLADAGAPAPPPRVLPRPAEPLEGGDEPVASPIPRREAAVAPPVEPQEPELDPEPEPEAQPAETATAGFTLVAQGAQPAASSPAAEAPLPPARSRLEGVAEVVATLPVDEVRRPPPPPRRAAEQRPPPARSAATRQSPSRVWVQLAHAPRPGPLPDEFAEVRAKAPALLGSRTPYVTLANRTNLLLVGPFDSRAAAQAFVRRLAQRDVTGLVWTSPAGQEIERLRIPNAAPSTRTTRATRAEATERAPARASRGRPEPEQRPAARGRRTR
jgi:hypothetical protein